MATRPFLVVILSRETHFFGDETHSRRHFEPENSLFRRRDSFSSPFRGGKCSILATIPFLVTILSRKLPFFGDDTLSRHHFKPKNSLFWRRDSFSSPFCGGKCSILATRPFLVVILSRKTPFFGDEIHSRHPFVAENALFWRRNPFSSPF
ncbi:hypothetical protein [Caldifermentibacillus hisashii]|uniref:hypothetical protein n=1 Tax=Caldifermentibacillus hisashii TaxID=996558 RepID=UPI0022B9837F|nr:hypothetical protein [Caldifermentibacillus hisashii]